MTARLKRTVGLLAGTAVLVGASASAQRTYDLENPSALLGDSIEEVIISLAQGFMGIVVVFAVFFIIYGGLVLVLSGGNQERIKKGKSTVLWAILGMAGIASLYQVLSFVVTLLRPDEGTPGVLSNPILGGNPNAFLGDIVTVVTQAFLALSIFATLVTVIWAGYFYLFSAGNAERIKTAQSVLLWAILGIAIIIASFSILSFTVTTIREASPPGFTELPSGRTDGCCAYEVFIPDPFNPTSVPTCVDLHGTEDEMRELCSTTYEGTFTPLARCALNESSGFNECSL